MIFVAGVSLELNNDVIPQTGPLCHERAGAQRGNYGPPPSLCGISQ